MKLSEETDILLELTKLIKEKFSETVEFFEKADAMNCNFFKNSGLRSLQIMQLITFIENKYSIRLIESNDDFDRLNSLSSIAALIEEKIK